MVEQEHERYVNPYTDFGFKKLFGTELNNVYTIGILNFVFPGDEYDKDCFHHEVKLMDVEDKHVFYDKLTYVYLEMPKFKKTEDELVSMYDKWLFVLKNLTLLMERPAALQERVFTRLFEQAEIARFSPDETRIYEESLKPKRGHQCIITYDY